MRHDWQISAGVPPPSPLDRELNTFTLPGGAEVIPHIGNGIVSAGSPE